MRGVFISVMLSVLKPDADNVSVGPHEKYMALRASVRV